MSKNPLQFNRLAEIPELGDYQQKPIENYGLNLLKGMGFSETRGIGKQQNSKPAQILVLKPRPRGLGLGAQNQQQAQKEEFQVGDRVQILDEPHKGMIGVVNLKINQDTVQVELYPSKSVIKISSKGIKKISKEEMEKKKINFNNSGEQKKKKRLKWVVPQIRVKIIDQKSPYYLKKVIVTQIISDREFECRDQSGRVLNNLTEKDIQTCIPKTGGLVLIVRGEHMGAKASVMERKKSKGKIVVQTVEELEIIKLPEDDVSQYIQL